MDNARSMYEGGDVWRADSPNMDYDLLEDLGLLCIYCGNLVFLKKGRINRPHFSHYQISDEKLDQCRLRQEAYASYASCDWKNLVEGKEQRLKILQNYFLEIVIREIENFREKFKEIKNSINYLDKIIDQASYLYRQNRSELVRHSANLCSSEKEDYPLQFQITCEAINYLTTMSGAPPLKELLTYSIYELIETGLYDLSHNANTYIVGKIGYKLAEILAHTDWVAQFNLIQRLKGSRSKHSNFESRLYTNFVAIDENPTEIQPNHLLLEQIRNVRISKEFERAVYFSQKLSRSEVFKNKDLDPLHPLQEYRLKFTSENKIMLHRLVDFGELKIQGTELCQFVEIREEVKSGEWISIHPRYECLLSSIGKDSSITIHKNPYYRQGLNMPIDLAYLNNDEIRHCLVAIGYPMKKKVFPKIVPSQSHLHQYEVLRNNIDDFFMKRYSYWLRNHWVKKMKEDLQNILVEEVLIRNFLVSRKDATQIAARLQELDFPIKEPCLVKIFSAIFYLPTDELQIFITEHAGTRLLFRCSEERNQTT